MTTDDICCGQATSRLCASCNKGQQECLGRRGQYEVGLPAAAAAADAALAAPPAAEAAAAAAAPPPEAAEAAAAPCKSFRDKVPPSLMSQSAPEARAAKVLSGLKVCCRCGKGKSYAGRRVLTGDRCAVR